LNNLGSTFVKAVRCIAQARGDHIAAALVAERKFGISSPIVETIKAAVHATGWAKEIASAAQNEFLGAVAEISVADKASRRVPLNRRLTGLVSGATAVWRAEGAPAAIGQMDLSNSSDLQPLNVTATIVVSKELIEVGDDENDERLRLELVKAVVDATDAAFASDDAAVSNVSPAGILAGVTVAAASSNPRDDIADLIDNFTGDLTKSVWIARPQVFARLHSEARIGIGLRGGELVGAPAFATRNAIADHLILCDADAILAGDDGFEVAASEEGTVQMSDGPSGAAQQVSLWQSGLIAISVTRRFNFRVMRTGSVAAIDGIAAAW
jgi:hypothetical protein